MILCDRNIVELRDILGRKAPKYLPDKQVIFVHAGNKGSSVLGKQPRQPVQEGGKIRHQHRHIPALDTLHAALPFLGGFSLFLGPGTIKH